VKCIGWHLDPTLSTGTRAAKNESSVAAARSRFDIVLLVAQGIVPPVVLRHRHLSFGGNISFPPAASSWTPLIIIVLKLSTDAAQRNMQILRLSAGMLKGELMQLCSHYSNSWLAQR
jgi:hypothetical protein